MSHPPYIIFVGGTFDGMHAGHQAVLQAAFKNGAKVVIGLTSDNFISKFKIHNGKICHCEDTAAGGGRGNPNNCRLTVTSYAQRHNTLFNWLSSQGYLPRSSILPIDDPYEPASSADYDALIVTQDNIERGREINTRRLARGLPPVKLIEVPIIPAEDGRPISSTRLRNGEVDTTGRLIMPESLRSLLHQPLGRILTTPQAIHRSLLGHHVLLITVGDMATQTLLDAGTTPDLSIIDQHLRRQPVDTLKSFGDPHTYSLHRLTSGPGYISNDAVNTIKSVYNHKPVVILVTGEEDLLALPTVLYAPDGSTVYYGQPPHAGKRSGLVEVKVGEKVRFRALTLLQQFHGFTANTT